MPHPGFPATPCLATGEASAAAEEEGSGGEAVAVRHSGAAEPTGGLVSSWEEVGRPPSVPLEDPRVSGHPETSIPISAAEALSPSGSAMAPDLETATFAPAAAADLAIEERRPLVMAAAPPEERAKALPTTRQGRKSEI